MPFDEYGFSTGDPAPAQFDLSAYGGGAIDPSNSWLYNGQFGGGQFVNAISGPQATSSGMFSTGKTTEQPLNFDENGNPDQQSPNYGYYGIAKTADQANQLKSSDPTGYYNGLVNYLGGVIGKDPTNQDNINVLKNVISEAKGAGINYDPNAVTTAINQNAQAYTNQQKYNEGVNSSNQVTGIGSFADFAKGILAPAAIALSAGVLGPELFGTGAATTDLGAMPAALGSDAALNGTAMTGGSLGLGGSSLASSLPSIGSVPSIGGMLPELSSIPGIGTAASALGGDALNASSILKGLSTAKTLAGLLGGGGVGGATSGTTGTGNQTAALLRNPVSQPTTPSFNYQSQPWLSSSTQSPIMAKTGLNVSGQGNPTMDMTQHNALMASILRNP